jgi:hypothetical protein
MDELARIAEIRAMYERLPKDELVVSRDGEWINVHLATQVETLYVIVRLQMNAAGQSVETLAVLDPDAQFALDQLVVDRTSSDPEQTSLRIEQLWLDVLGGADRELVCRSAVEGLFARFKAKPRLYVLMFRQMPRGRSVRTVRGGAPGLRQTSR